MANLNILCCDGGGIRGLIPAILINNIASAVSSFRDTTSLFAGTSTGGIIAIALAAGVETDDIVGIYANSCSTIFSQSIEDSPASSITDMDGYIKNFVPSKYQGTVADVVVGIVAAADAAGTPIPKNLFSAKYSNAPLTTLLQNLFNTTTVGDSNVKPMFVTTFQLDNSSAQQWLPTSIDNLQGSATIGCSLVEAALSTGAAPTFFPPYNNSALGYCVDGGTFANNPSMFVLAKALSLGYSLADIRMLSIGTGQNPNAVPSSYLDNPATGADLWGTYQYMFPLDPTATMPNELLLNLLMDGSSIVNDQQAGILLGSSQYLRINPGLDETVALDDCSVIESLTTTTNNYWSNAQDLIVNWITTNWV